MGHALIIPRCHSETFLELPPESLGGIVEVTQRVSRALVEALGLEGFNIFSNNGKIAGQSVFHFHWHATPRYGDDNIRFELHSTNTRMVRWRPTVSASGSISIALRNSS